MTFVLHAALPKLTAIVGQVIFGYTAFQADPGVACSTEQPPVVCNQELAWKLLMLTDMAVEAPEAYRDRSLL